MRTSNRRDAVARSRECLLHDYVDDPNCPLCDRGAGFEEIDPAEDPDERPVPDFVARRTAA